MQCLKATGYTYIVFAKLRKITYVVFADNLHTGLLAQKTFAYKLSDKKKNNVHSPHVATTHLANHIRQ